MRRKSELWKHLGSHGALVAVKWILWSTKKVCWFFFFPIAFVQMNPFQWLSAHDSIKQNSIKRRILLNKSWQSLITLVAWFYSHFYVPAKHKVLRNKASFLKSFRSGFTLVPSFSHPETSDSTRESNAQWALSRGCNVLREGLITHEKVGSCIDHRLTLFTFLAHSLVLIGEGALCSLCLVSRFSAR